MSEPDRTQAVTAERFVPAPPAEVFDLLTDPTQHPVLDGSGTVQRSRSASDGRLRLGSTFGMNMRMGVLPYRVVNKVVEFEANRRIAWQHLGRHRWRWQLEAVEGGTLVRETFDWSTAVSPRLLELMGYPERNLAAMEQTLERLAAHFGEGDTPTE